MKPLDLATTLSATLLVLNLTSQAQYCTIKDPDGYTNVRADKSSKAKIKGRLHNGDLFTTGVNNNPEWIMIYYWPNDANDSGYLEGYVHADRIQAIEDLKHIPSTPRFTRLATHNSPIQPSATQARQKTRPHSKDRR